jgi:hypothetical protein
MQDAVSSENCEFFLCADGLIEGGGPGEIADWQVDEDQFGHEKAPFWRGFRNRTSGAGLIRHPV